MDQFQYARILIRIMTFREVIGKFTLSKPRIWMCNGSIRLINSNKSSKGLQICWGTWKG